MQDLPETSTAGSLTLCLGQGPWYCSCGLSLSQERHYPFLPKERHSLMTITHWHNSGLAVQASADNFLAPMWPPCGPLWKNIEVTALATRATPSSNSTLKRTPKCPRILGGLGKGPGLMGRGQEKGKGYMLPSFQCLPEKIRLKEQTRNPLSLGKKKKI